MFPKQIHTVYCRALFPPLGNVSVHTGFCGSRCLCAGLKHYFASRPAGLTSERRENCAVRVLCGVETTGGGLQFHGHHRQLFRGLQGKTPLINLWAGVQGFRDKHILNFPHA